MKLLPEVSQKYVILKITTFETLLAMPHSQIQLVTHHF